MDEPLSNLDAKLRVAMRAELARLHGRLGVTTVYVTHDQVEAMTLGSRVAVLCNGVLQQCDAPEALYRRPVNVFVAAFIGSPSMNLLEARVDGGAARLGQHVLELAPEMAAGLPTGDLILGLRPSDFVPAGPGVDPRLPRMRVIPDVVERLGSEILIVFGVDATGFEVNDRGEWIAGGEAQLVEDHHTRLTARLEEGTSVRIGEPIELAVRRDRLHFFDRETGDRIDTSAPVAVAR
jgi:multiple sugar transport system ATP-binding protein